jgi:IS30 family transposase
MLKPINRLKKLSANGRHTLTLDNGTENAKHEQLSASLIIKCYFAHPLCILGAGYE